MQERYEVRIFRDGERLVDIHSPDALLPIGTRITCEAGHAITVMAESVYTGQRVPPSVFGPFEPFQGLRGRSRDIERGIPGQLCGPCVCGRRWSAYGQLHTAAGWVPDFAERSKRRSTPGAQQ